MNRVLFVCLGNICRSPLAEGIFRRKLVERGLDHHFTVDSAGTGDWHIGQLPDERARRIGAARGCIMTMRARQVRKSDFEDFDIILAMDRQNYADLLRWPGSDPGRVVMMLDFDGQRDSDNVPDPYYGGPEGFERVVEMLERSCDGLIEHILSDDPSRFGLSSGLSEG